MIDRLQSLAEGGDALELGIGTGRVALPLRQQGVSVAGIDASDAMLAELRAKPGGADIPVHVGDFTAFELGRRFTLIYAVFNTFFALLTQDEQLRCFDSVAAHLEDDGVFVLELFVPDLSRFAMETRMSASPRWGSTPCKLTPPSMIPRSSWSAPSTSSWSRTNFGSIRLELRYAWPSELDLMAKLAALERRDRWSDWDGSSFGPRSEKHISVYAPGS
jgi:SAM-dependent methyltransferase